MSWLSKILASLLVAAVCLAIICQVLAHTVLNAQYLSAQAKQANVYTRLATVLPSQLTDHSNNPENSQMKAVLQQVLTADYIQTKVTAMLTQLQDYYSGKSSQLPTLDLSDLKARAQALGAPVPADANLDKPIVFKANPQAQNIAGAFNRIKLYSLIASVLLLGLLLFVSWEMHRYLVLPDVAIAAGVLVSIVSVVFLLVPNLVAHFIKADSGGDGLNAIGRDLIGTIAHGVGVRFLTIGLALFIPGVILRIWLGRLKPAPVTAKKK